MSVLDQVIAASIRFAVRYGVNLIQATFIASVLGNTLFAVSFFLLLMVTGDGNAVEGSWVYPAFEAMGHILESATGEAAYSGDFQGIGMIFLQYLMPYLALFSFVISIVEGLIRRRIFKSIGLSVPNCLKILLVIYILLPVITFFGNVSHEEVPYPVRFAIFAMMYLFAALNVVMAYGLGFAAEKGLQQYLGSQVVSKQ